MHLEVPFSRRFLKKLTWSIPAILIAATATLTTIKVKTDEIVPPSSVPTQQLRVISRALDFISKNYVDPEKVDPLKMLEGATKELSRSIPPFLVKKSSKNLDIRMGSKELHLPYSNPLSRNDLSLILSRILGYLNMFYEGRLDEQERLTLAMTGITDTLDPHTNYLSPKVYNEFRIGTKGNFGGLGIVIGIRDGDLAVIAPLEGTPAFKAGLKSKDKIVQIGEEATINMGLTEAVEKLRGPIGTQVSIVVVREGIAEPIKFTLTRALIKIQSVAGRLLEDRKVGLIKVKNFQEDTVEELKKTIRTFESQVAPMDGIILDLRNDPGGLLDQAVALSDFFLEEGVIVKTVGAHGEPLDLEQAAPGDVGEEIPLVVIVNEGSASASEIVSGALQFNNRAIVIGNRTFGKGSVQTVYDLKDGSALKITIAKYLTAKDHPVQSIGINPDIGLLPATVPDSFEKMIPQEGDQPKPPQRLDLYEDVKKRELDLLALRSDEEDEQKEANLPPSPFQVTYLQQNKDPDEEETGKIALDGDFPVLLGARLLGLSQKLKQYMPAEKALQRDSLVGALPPLLEELKKEEEQKIQQALTKLSVDWSVGPKDGKPTGSAIIELLDKQEKPKKSLEAGETGFLKVTFQNTGKSPFYQLAAVTQSDDPLFANLEFPFGRVDPGQTKSWKTPLRIPNFANRRSIPVTLKWHEEYDRLPKSSEMILQVSESSSPRFAYSYRLLDDGTNGSKGNGNHQVDGGETITLQVRLQNIGDGESSKPVVNLRKDEGEETLIQKGREELKSLPPGGSAETALRFRVPAKLPQKLSFDLNIHDTHLGDDLNDHLVVSALPPQDQLQAPPKIDLPWESLPLSASAETYTIKGTATDDRSLKNVVIFVGEDKLFYQSPEKISNTLNFETTVALKKGANLITLAAQDDRDLTTRKQWIVWRNK